MPAVLQVSKGLTEGTIISLDADKYIMGRNPECGIVIPFNAVSREHAQILRIQGKYFIEDKQSRNGTFVNDKSITTRTQLKHNDKIRICDFLATFVEGQLPLPEPEPEHDNSTVEATLAPSASAHTLLETQPAEKLRGLLEIGAALSKTLELDSLLPKIAESLFSLFRQADRCFLIQSEEPVRAGDKPRLLPRLVKTRKATDDATARFSSSIVRRCLEQGQALLFDDASKDDRMQLSQSVVDFRIRSVMCVPLLRADGRPFGVIQLDTQDRSKKFKEEDLKLLTGVANQASVALENARLLQDAVFQAKLNRDLEVAHQVQMSFLPSELPTLPTYEFAAHYQPAQSVGGDYYGFQPLPSGRMVVSVGDVAGKGIPAALLMAKLSSEMRSCALTSTDPAEVVMRLNDLMYPFTNPLDKFVTLGLMLLDPVDHAHLFVSAGHPPPMIYNPRTSTFKDALAHEDGGLPMGMLEGYPYEIRPLTMQPGEIMVIYSDGLPEPVNREEIPFGMEGIQKAVKGMGATTAQALVTKIVTTLKQYVTGTPPFDDITLVAVRRTA